MNPHTKNEQIEHKPFLAWVAIFALILFTSATIAAGAGSIMRQGYIALTFGVGILLYARYPNLYLGLVWWVWFITPLLSRLIDIRSGFDESRLILLSQYLVSLITLHTLAKDLPKSYRQGGLPFILAVIAVGYGFLIGLVKTSPVTAARSLLDWLTPISFGFYIFTNWQKYPLFRKNIQRVFLWGVLVTGIYGIIQYLVAPEWDRFWLISTKITSFGDPEPLKIRVWSTMSSPGPYASMMMAGLLLLFTCKGTLTIPAAGAGYLTFLLTMVRSLWGCWLVGLITMLSSFKPRLQMRLIITIIIMAICVIPLTKMEPFADAINTRLQTLTTLEKDDSARVRQQIYEDGISSALSNGIGNGIGNTFILDKDGKLVSLVVDSGFLETFFTLGWVGGIFYWLSMIMLTVKILQFPESRLDSFMSASRAVAIASICALPIGSSMLGFSGILMWGFLGVVMAAHRYHQQQKNIMLENWHLLNSRESNLNPSYLPIVTE